MVLVLRALIELDSILGLYRHMGLSDKKPVSPRLLLLSGNRSKYACLLRFCPVCGREMFRDDRERFHGLREIVVGLSHPDIKRFLIKCFSCDLQIVIGAPIADR